MSAVDELYQEIILDHYRAPRNKGACPDCGRTAHHSNPLCGDEIDVHVLLTGDRIDKVRFDGHGCSISQASASMMAERAEGTSVAEALALGQAVREMMHGDGHADDELERRLGDLASLAGVARFPVRVKCALLPWAALGDCLADAGGSP